MTKNRASAVEHKKVADLARQWARRTVLGMVREAGGTTVSRPAFHDRSDLDITVTDAEPMAGMQAAVHLSHAAIHLTQGYVRQAREEGHGWHEIGVALGLVRPVGSDRTTAEAAFDYAAGDGSPTWERSVAWTCRACQGRILDRGPEAGHPLDAEPGHADNCPRLAEAIAAWESSWADEDG